MLGATHIHTLLCFPRRQKRRSLEGRKEGRFRRHPKPHASDVQSNLTTCPPMRAYAWGILCCEFNPRRWDRSTPPWVSGTGSCIYFRGRYWGGGLLLSRQRVCPVTLGGGIYLRFRAGRGCSEFSQRPGPRRTKPPAANLAMSNASWDIDAFRK